MSRLIRAEDVKELLLGLDSLPWEEQVDEIVDSIETAFDVEAVVRELEREKYLNINEPWNIGWNAGLSKAIEIVRGGRNEA